MRLRTLKTRADHREALAQIEKLWTAKPGTKGADLLDVLTVLVEAYERAHDEPPAPDPIEAILFRMEQSEMSRADLQRVLGAPRGRVSEILNRRRPLTLAMIRRLVAELEIPAEVLIQPAQASGL